MSGVIFEKEYKMEPISPSNCYYINVGIDYSQTLGNL